MTSKFRLFSLGMIAAVFVLAASSSWAAPDCTTVVLGSGANETKVAVAANFVAAARQLILECLGDGTCDATTKYAICSDSTGNLMQAIGTPCRTDTGYGYFFAADTSAASYNGCSGAGTPYVYATGVPVFFAVYNTAGIHAVNQLMTPLSTSDRSYSFTSVASTSYMINTASAAQVVVANTSAPYGVKGRLLVSDMMGITIPPVPGYVHEAGNIGDAYNHVIGGWDGVKSGFVGRSQIWDANSTPPGVPSDFVFVQFTDPRYLLTQNAILLNSSDVAAAALHSYISALMSGGGSDWRTFITRWGYLWP